MQNVVMNAFYGERRSKLDTGVRKLLAHNAPTATEPERIEIPTKLYLRIKKLADITRDRAEFATELKADLAASGLLQKSD